ncbi:MAG: carbamoyltransferase C-terminal domain-containing protein, partial [Patescibacteria group bacterium]
ELVRALIMKTGKRKVCLTGGVALNCNANAKLLIDKIVDDLFILPASSDKGQAIGNALYGFHLLEGYCPRNRLRNDYFGRTYSETEILSTLNRKGGILEKYVPTHDFKFDKQNDIAKTVANLLAQEKIVGWFQKGSELGPRALGHRSILCDPRKIGMRHILNSRVKHREEFRPFAPSCIQKRASEYFELDHPSPYMLLSMPVKESVKNLIPAVVHVDGTSRIQTVTHKNNDKFYALLEEFDRITGMPMVLNTSFNDRGPIVETPMDALSVFLGTDMDYLAIGDFLIHKT